MRITLRSFVVVSLLGFAAAAGAQERWVGSWGAAPLPPAPARGPFQATPSFDDQTIRQLVRLSAGGTAVRLRLSNEYGAKPLTVGAASLALVGADGDVIEATRRDVTFGGEPVVTIPAGAPMISDPIELAVDELASLSVSLYFPGNTGQCTCHQTGMQTAYVASGDRTDEPFEGSETMQWRAFLTGVEVLAPATDVIVVLGDSISDGIGSTVDANRRWPDLLAERLAARDDERQWGIVNMGISGNRVLADGAGESALARLDRDVLAVSGASSVIVFEGVNDLGIAYGDLRGGPAESLTGGAPQPPVTADQLIAGYEQIIVRAHARGLEVVGATIAPYEGAAYYAAEGNAVREAVNRWIREGGAFDGVLDFDAVLRDPDQPTQLADGLHAGDFLHGSDAGYRVLADSIDLGLFD